MTYPEKINHLEADLQAEVERLKASNAELVEALKHCINLLELLTDVKLEPDVETVMGWAKDIEVQIREARVAIAKAEEEK